VTEVDAVTEAHAASMAALSDDEIVEAADKFAAEFIARGYLRKGYTWRWPSGEPIYWTIRCQHPETRDKWIRPMHFDGRRFRLGEPQFAGPKPLYGLDQLARADASAAVWVVEGPNKVSELKKLGLVAVTSGSANTANDRDWTPLAGRKAIIWPDNDDPGRAYAGDVAAILLNLGCSVECIDVAQLSLPDRGDVVDWLELHPNATAKDIGALPRIAAAQRTATGLAQPGQGKPPVAPLRAVTIDELLEMELPAREIWLAPWLTRQCLAMLWAQRGVGKTHVALGIAYAVASGGEFLGWKADAPRRVLYVDGEMPAGAMKDRLAHIVLGAERDSPPDFFRLLTPDLQDGTMPDLGNGSDQRELDALIDACGAELIVIDNLSTLLRSGGAENEAESWLPVQAWALRHRAHGRSALFVHHAGKSNQQRGTSRREDVLDVVISLKRPSDYEAEDGARFELRFEKARHVHGRDAQPLEARLVDTGDGRPRWEARSLEESTFDRAVALTRDGLRQGEIAAELGVNKSTVCRHLKRAGELGLISSEEAKRR